MKSDQAVRIQHTLLFIFFVVTPFLAKGDLVNLEIQIDDPFSPFKTRQEERQFAIKNDHASGSLNPLPEVIIQIDGKEVFKKQLSVHGNRMTHIHYGKATSSLAADTKEVSLRFLVPSQEIDQTIRVSLAKGRHIVLSKKLKSKEIVLKQLKSRPLYK